MSQPIVIALDAMGGDKAPEIVVLGARLALERDSQLQFLLFGDEEKLKALMPEAELSEAFKIIHAPEVISADLKGASALRQGKDSSMRMALDAVAEKKASAVVSAGNTGALMVLARFILKTLPGVDRPAIASLFPTQRGECVMLDLGANLECTTDNLVQFATMGSLFARRMFDITTPTVGLLNVGVEDQKGHEAIRDAAAQLRSLSFSGKFIGFVEGNDIPAGMVDVVVTDGFTGNIALKMAEGMGRMMTVFLRKTFAASWVAMLGYLLARGAFARLKRRLDPRRYNGGVFLGLQGVCVKSHGGTDHEGFANAIEVAASLVRGNLTASIAEEMALISALPAPAVAGA